jgi:hypothetical protein
MIEEETGRRWRPGNNTEGKTLEEKEMDGIKEEVGPRRSGAIIQGNRIMTASSPPPAHLIGKHTVEPGWG